MTVVTLVLRIADGVPGESAKAAADGRSFQAATTLMSDDAAPKAAPLRPPTTVPVRAFGPLAQDTIEDAMISAMRG